MLPPQAFCQIIEGSKCRNVSLYIYNMKAGCPSVSINKLQLVQNIQYQLEKQVLKK